MFFLIVLAEKEAINVNINIKTIYTYYIEGKKRRKLREGL